MRVKEVTATLTLEVTYQLAEDADARLPDELLKKMSRKAFEQGWMTNDQCRVLDYKPSVHLSARHREVE